MTPIVIERFNDDDGDQKGDMMVQILQLDVRGMPQEWITPEDAATYYATDSVAWTVGSVIHTLLGERMR